ncbi:hypothetical protein MKW94_008019 [Papaver nudicaule]|uniref:TPX2 C-terminal domain-containing protein n=1 Tax=Papaver nudicaule TaxID=74823 RepID=A0AA41SE36_PAPNU|nr:hypothetical protein [Papaver nudicaule]
MVEQMAEAFEREEKVMATEKDFSVSVSVSFGKYENDLLSWDRWSSFSQNKYLEEVEKCSTPGSVASKKAYFEAHYKKIAARNAAAELLEQEQQFEADSVASNCPSNGKQAQDEAEEDNFEFDLGRQNRTKGFRRRQLSLIHANESNQDTDGVGCQDSISQVSEEETHIQQHNFKAEELEASVPHQDETPEEQSKTETEELEMPISVQGENQRLQEHNLRHTEMHCQQHNLNTKESEASVSVQLEDPLERSKVQAEEVVLIEEKNCYIESHAKVEEVPILIKEESQSVSSPPGTVQEENISTRSQEQEEAEKYYSGSAQPGTSDRHVEGTGTSKSKPRKEPRKVRPRVPASKEIPAKTMRKLAAPKTKTAQTSVSKASKPSPSSPAISTTSGTPTRKDSGPSLPKNKQIFSADNKQSTSSALLPPANSDSSFLPPANSDSSFLNTTRRSLIMEQMGDKEIIKRAFKTFKNTYGTPLSTGEGTSSTFQQLSGRTSSSTSPQKDKKGTAMSSGKASPHTKQVAVRPTSLSASPVRPAGAKQTITKASTTSFRLKSDLKAEKHKEVLKKHDGKLKAAEVDKTPRLRSKSKDVAHQTMSWR